MWDIRLIQSNQSLEGGNRDRRVWIYRRLWVCWRVWIYKRVWTTALKVLKVPSTSLEWKYPMLQTGFRYKTQSWGLEVGGEGQRAEKMGTELRDQGPLTEERLTIQDWEPWSSLHAVGDEMIGGRLGSEQDRYGAPTAWSCSCPAMGPQTHSFLILGYWMLIIDRICFICICHHEIG